MQNENATLPLDIYYKHLTKINGIEFTPREVDVISCILNRRASSISSFLSIGQRAVETHNRNIRQKAGGLAGRDNIIDFIEKSGKLSFIKSEYYLSLRFRVLFEKKLSIISKKLDIKSSSCLLVYEKGQKYNPSLIPYLKEHLKHVGFDVKTYPSEEDKFFIHPKEIINREQTNHVLYIFPQNLSDVQVSQINTSHLSNIIFLFHQNTAPEDVYKKLKNNNYINWLEKGNYYLSFFEILKKLLPHGDFEHILEEFKEQYSFINESFDTEGLQEGSTPQKELPCPPRRRNFADQKKWCFLIGLIVSVSMLSLGLFIISEGKEKESSVAYSIAKQSGSLIRSDLILPNETTLVNLPKLMDQIDNKFKGGNGIQSVALVGIGGSGKTTLARQYARQQKENIIWEINAESSYSLSESFDNLAHVLSQTEEDQKLLRSIREIKNSEEREVKILEFVKKGLKLYLNWFLIYDNVENFKDIQKYFPQDSNTWGEGKIILTTRNTNIQNNSQINGIILVGELSPDQKLSLFMQIMKHEEKNKLSATQQQEAVEFLKQLPPFPLDVSVAAYYLKTMNVPYGRYLEHLNDQNKSFSNIQENLLKEAGAYEKTRYNIITLSLEKLIAADKNFADLLLFISLIDSQNIPRELLDIYKGRSAVDNFIYYLNKYSLIVNTLSDSTSLLSIHRSTQDISFSYLTNFLKLKKDSQSLKEIAYALDDYSDQALEQEDFAKMQVIARHIEKFLTRHDVVADFSKGLLESKLGSIYYFINDDKSKRMLGDSLNILERKSFKHLSSENDSRLARSFLHIGAVYTELRLDKEAEEVLKKAMHVYGKEGSNNYLDLSLALSHLGDLQKRLGNFEEARDYLEKSIHLHKQYGSDNKRIARTLAYLGSVYRGLGLYQKAIDTLEESLAIYKKNYSNDHIRLGWILIHLGNVHRRLGNLKQAKEALERGLSIFQKHFPKDHVSMGLVLAYLGGCHRDLGDYEKSCDYLEDSLRIHQKYFDAKHVKMGWILFHLASTYKAMGNNKAQKLFDKVLEIYSSHCDENNIEIARMLRNMAKICIEKNWLEDADNYIQRSLTILCSRQHVETYRSLKTLGEILLKKSAQITYAKNNQEAQDLRNQAINKFNQALKIAEQHFPKNSVHIQKIHARVKSIQK